MMTTKVNISPRYIADFISVLEQVVGEYVVVVMVCV